MNAIHLVYWFVIWFASALYYAFSLSKVVRPRKPNCRSFSRFTAVKLGRFQCLLSKTRLWDLKVWLLKPGPPGRKLTNQNVNWEQWTRDFSWRQVTVCLKWNHKNYRLDTIECFCIETIGWWLPRENLMFQIDICPRREAARAMC